MVPKGSQRKGGRAGGWEKEKGSEAGSCIPRKCCFYNLVGRNVQAEQVTLERGEGMKADHFSIVMG
jgi:hypothetical protein